MSYKYKVGEEYESRNQEQIDSLTQQYVDRGQFSYDPAADSAYQTYVKLMKENGQKAMEDTMGKATSMTGGYGNSYAAAAGQQVYNDYMREANAARSDFEDRARDDLLSRLSILQNQESTDRANWESDYAHAWSDAQMKAEYGDVSKMAGLLNMDETALKVALGYGEVSDELLVGFQNAIKNGKGREYLNSLVADGYNPKDLVEKVNRWSADGSLGGIAALNVSDDGEYSFDYTPDEEASENKVYGMGAIIPKSFKFLGDTETGEKFEIRRTSGGGAFHGETYGDAGDNWNLTLGKEYTEGDLFDKLSDQDDGFVYYDGTPYYVSAGRVFKVGGKDYENLKKYLSDQYG